LRSVDPLIGAFTTLMAAANLSLSGFPGASTFDEDSGHWFVNQFFRASWFILSVDAPL
jgi:hypothetical protein